MKIVPLEKQSKAAQREFHSRQRRSWNGIIPVTRAVPDKTKYDRDRYKRACRKKQVDS